MTRWEQACDRIDDLVWIMSTFEDDRDRAPRPALDWYDRKLAEAEVALENTFYTGEAA